MSPHPRVPQPERINPETNQKGYNVKSDIWSLGITMVNKPFVVLDKVKFTFTIELLFFLSRGSDRARHPAFSVRLVGDAVPAAEAGSGGTFASTSCRPVLPRVCGLQLSVVGLS